MERNLLSDKKRGAVPAICSLSVLLLLLVVGCQRTTVPVIQGTYVRELSPAVIEVSATITPAEVIECGVCYSQTVTAPTPDDCDAIIAGTLTGNQFTATVTLKAHTTYYIAVYATGEAGRTVTRALKITTAYTTPSPSDNPLPGV